MNIKIPVTVILIPLSLVLLASCSTYLVSPLDTGSNPYIPMPLKKKDSAATTQRYGSIYISPGFAGNGEGDAPTFNYGAARFMQSHAFGSFRAGYGANLMLGSYNTGAKNEFSSDPAGLYRSKNGGNLFFGAVGINAKISYAVPFKNGRGEWRIIGVEGAAHREFGKYLSYRQNYPAEGDDYIERREFTYTAGIFTEFMSSKKRGKQFGFKMGLSLQTLPKLFYAFDPYKDDNSDELKEPPAIPHYVNLAFIFGRNNVLAFVQPNIGTAAVSVQAGVLFKLQ